MNASVIDVCCGSKMFWYRKDNPEVIYMDNRKLEDILCDGRKLVIKPDVIGDFRNIPYPDNTFKLAVFDPPHLLKVGEKSWLAKKYGKLNPSWKDDIKQGFDECMRVLEPHGILVFKWNEEQIKTSDILKAINYTPLFGDKRSKTHWMVFMKESILNAVLKTEYSEEFDNKRKNRMFVGWNEYGPIKQNYENGFIKAIESCENCIELYRKTGNKKYLIDMANFAMIEYMHPAHKNVNENYGDSAKSATFKKLCYREIENAGK